MQCHQMWRYEKHDMNTGNGERARKMQPYQMR